jgi:hypothetical protein
MVLLSQLAAEVLQLMVVTNLVAGRKSLELVEVLEFFGEALDKGAFADAPPATADDQPAFGRRAVRRNCASSASRPMNACRFAVTLGTSK